MFFIGLASLIIPFWIAVWNRHHLASLLSEIGTSLQKLMETGADEESILSSELRDSEIEMTSFSNAPTLTDGALDARVEPKEDLNCSSNNAGHHSSATDTPENPPSG